MKAAGYGNPIAMEMISVVWTRSSFARFNKQVLKTLPEQCYSRWLQPERCEAEFLLWHLHRSSGAVRLYYTMRDKFPNIDNFPIQVCIFCRYRKTESFIQHIISYPYSLDSWNSNKHSDMTCQHCRKHFCMSGSVETTQVTCKSSPTYSHFHARDFGVRFLFFRFSNIMVLFWNKAVVLFILSIL